MGTAGIGMTAAGSGGTAAATSAGTMAPAPEAGSGADAGVTSTSEPDAAVAPTKPRLAVTADFLNKTLSVVDIDKLHEGGTRADALVGTVDLSMYTPGPMALNITPDGKTALVSISAGFLNAFITVPPGAGTLLWVDLATLKVTGELYIGNSPMGIVFSKDGKRAFVGLYSENYFAVVDVEKRTYEPVATGVGFNEELAIDDSGTVGILTYGPAGNVVTFSVADPAAMMGQTIALTGDAGGAAFFPGTKKAYVMQAPTILTGNVGGHNVVDVSNPTMPVAGDDVRINAAPTMYPVTAVPARGSVAYGAYENNAVSIVEMKLEGDVAKEAQRVNAGEATNMAYGLSATADGKILFAVPGDHYVGVVDLATGKSFHVPWEVTMSGPTEIKAVPQ